MCAYDVHTGQEQFINGVNTIPTGDSEDFYEIETVDGKKIICTENHLILTDRGFVKASDLLCTDKIIKVKNEVC